MTHVDRQGVVRAVKTQDIAIQLGVAASTLDYWIKHDLCAPSLVSGRGQRYQRLWSVRDAVMVRVVKQLRANGMPLQRIRLAREELDRNWQLGMNEVVLFWDGHSVIALDSEGELMELLDHSGQYAMVEVVKTVSIPVAEWFKDAEALGEDVDIAALERRREERATRLNRRTEGDRPIELLRRFFEENGAG